MIDHQKNRKTKKTFIPTGLGDDLFNDIMGGISMDEVP